MATAHKAKQDNTLLGIEALRFIAAIAVLFWHYQHFSFVADVHVNFIRENQPFYSLFKLFYDHGISAVQVFWSISGFIFFWKYGTAIAGNKVGAWTFFLLRFSRLYPLHLVTLLIVLCLQMLYFSHQSYFFVYQNQDLWHFLLQLVFASNWGIDSQFSFNGPIWSVSTEVLVYAVFFLCTRRCGISPYINAGVFCLCVIGKALKIHTFVIDCLMFFYIGGLPAIALSGMNPQQARKLRYIILTLLVLMTPAIFALHLYATLPHLALLVIYTPLLLCVISQDFNVSPRMHELIRAAGNMTYSSYLLHFPIQLLIALCYAYAGIAIPFYNDGFFIFFMAVVLVASYFTYRYFEKPMQDSLRRKGLAKQ